MNTRRRILVVAALTGGALLGPLVGSASAGREYTFGWCKTFANNPEVIEACAPILEAGPNRRR